MESDRLLKEVHKVLVLDLTEYIGPLRKKYSECFLPPEEGIYMAGAIEPIIKAGQVIFSESGYKTLTPLQSLDDVNEGLLDKDGELIISAPFMRHRKKFLHTKPTLPVREIQVAAIMADDFIDSMLPYTPARETYRRVLDHLKPEYHYLSDEGHIEAALTKITNEVSLFVNADIWNIYFFEQKKTDLIITQSVDFRVYDWTKKLEEEAFDLDCE